MRGLGKRFRWKIFELPTYRIQHVGPQHQHFSEVGFREGLSSRPLVNARPITRRISLSSTTGPRPTQLRRHSHGCTHLRQPWYSWALEPWRLLTHSFSFKPNSHVCLCSPFPPSSMPRGHKRATPGLLRAWGFGDSLPTMLRATVSPIWLRILRFGESWPVTEERRAGGAQYPHPT